MTDKGEQLRVGMHSSKKIVDTEICHENGDESSDKIYMRNTRTLQSGDKRGVERNDIDEERYESPYLFRIPPPVATPRLASPYRTDENAEREERNGHIEKEERNAERLLGPTRGESDDAVEHYDGEKGVGDHDTGDMEREPWGVEDRHKWGDVGIADGDMRNEESKARHEETGRGKEELASAEEESDDGKRESEKKHCLVAIGERPCTGDDPSGDK